MSLINCHINYYIIITDSVNKEFSKIGLIRALLNLQKLIEMYLTQKKSVQIISIQFDTIHYYKQQDIFSTPEAKPKPQVPFPKLLPPYLIITQTPKAIVKFCLFLILHKWNNTAYILLCWISVLKIFVRFVRVVFFHRFFPS